MESQQSTSINRIVNNSLILSHIFQYLNCTDQLNNAQVCVNFLHVIVNHIWKIKYKKLHVLQFMHKHVILSVMPNEALNEHNYKRFLALNSHNIQELNVNNFSTLKKSCLIIELPLAFPNLLKLSVRDIKFTQLNIENVLRNFANLKCIHLKNCFLENGAAIHTLADFDSEIFLKMRFLEEVKIQHSIVLENVYMRN